MSKKDSKQTEPRGAPALGRRAFLRSTAMAGAGVAALGAASSLVGGELPVAEAGKPEQAPAEKGYRLTEHIAAYYRTASN